MNGINLTYEQLIATFPPRPITSDGQYWATQERIDALLDKVSLTPDEEDYLTVLGMMIELYEEQHEPDIDLRGVALIRVLLEEQGLRQRDLVEPVFKTDSIASAVLNEKRRLTVEHIDKLAAYFNLPHTLFFEPKTEAVSTLSDLNTSDKYKPVSPPPKNPRPSVFVEFIDSSTLEEWQAQSIKQNTIEKFQFNRQRLRDKSTI